MPSTLDDYEEICTIGSGSYGCCKKVQRRRDGKVFVWKELVYGDMTEQEKMLLVSEVNVLRELRHAHIVRYHDRIIERHRATIYIIMEYCEGGDLARKIERRKKQKKTGLDESFVWQVFQQLVSALSICHRRKQGGAILHRDIKPANVFLDTAGNVKLGDFGLARILAHNTSFAKTFVGTPYYMSPEQVLHDSYNEKSDIWSLGCLVYELCTLRPPFCAATQKLLALKIREGRFQPIPSSYSAELDSLIRQILNVEACERPSVDELLKHPKLQTPTPQPSAAIIGRRPSADVHTEKPLTVLKDGALSVLEEALRAREEELTQREKDLKAWEARLLQRETELEERVQRAERMMQDAEDMSRKAAAGKAPASLAAAFQPGVYVPPNGFTVFVDEDCHNEKPKLKSRQPLAVLSSDVLPAKRKGRPALAAIAPLGKENHTTKAAVSKEMFPDGQEAKGKFALHERPALLRKNSAGSKVDGLGHRGGHLRL